MRRLNLESDHAQVLTVLTVDGVTTVLPVAYPFKPSSEHPRAVYGHGEVVAGPRGGVLLRLGVPLQSPDSGSPMPPPSLFSLYKNALRPYDIIAVCSAVFRRC